MNTIEIDFDVFKEITIRRAAEDVTPNDVLREIFNLEPKQNGDEAPAGKPWVIKGVTFPHETEFRATYKGQLYKAVVEDGSLVLSEKKYSSPSKAAMSITGNNVNGWNFWECKMPGVQGWKVIKKFRTQ